MEEFSVNSERNGDVTVAAIVGRVDSVTAPYISLVKTLKVSFVERAFCEEKEDF